LKSRLKGIRGLEAKRGLGIVTKRILGIAVAVVTLLMVNLTPAFAGSLDPPLFIGNTTQCADSSCTALGTGSVAGEGIGISANTLTIYDQGAAGSTAQSPILLIIAVPDVTTSYVPPGISTVSTSGSGTWTGSIAGSDVYGGTWNTTTGSAGSFNSSSSGSVYNTAGIANDGGGSSQNWTNLSTLDGQLGINASSFDVFVYTLTGSSSADLAQTQYLTVDFSGNLALGTFAMAYGCESGNSTSSGCSPVGNVYSTPFTHVGDVTSVPEPGSIALLGLVFGAVGMAGLGLRSKPV
jgi:hypothetical protein